MNSRELNEQAFRAIKNYEPGTEPNAEIVDFFRYLRNSVASDESVGRLILDDDHGDIVKKTASIIKSNDDDELSLSLSRCALQLLGNLATRFDDARFLVCDELRSSFVDLLNRQDEKIKIYTSMTLFNCSANEFVRDDFCKNENHDNSRKILDKILQIVKNGGNEWCLFTVERFLIDSNLFLSNFWSYFSRDDQILMTEICVSMIESKRFPNESNVLSLMEIYKKSAEKLVNRDCEEDSLKFDEKIFKEEIHLFLPLLTFFCKITCDPSSISVENGSVLLESTVILLRTIQKLSRANHPFFAVVKLAKAPSSNLVDVDHPSTGLKRDLVNLIANLCYQCPTQQNLARQLDAVPLILDCTMMDSRNHFITQWAILALRNLLDNCPENQRVVSTLNAQSVIDNSQMLDQLQLEPYLDDEGRVKLKTKR